jgi:glycine C-acetyltransferase
MYERGFLVTNINYPVVPKGKDEIRVQISAAHTREDLNDFIDKATRVGKEIKLI